MSEFYSSNYLSEYDCVNHHLCPSDRHVWNDYLERYMPYHLILAEAGERLTETIVGRPELFKGGRWRP